MAFSQTDIDRALEYAETVKFSATLNPGDQKTIEFQVSKKIPDTIENKDVRELLDIAIQYYQRSIFTGEYLMADDDPPTRKSSGEPIDDINFYLSYYKTHLIEELKKAYNLDENLKVEKDDGLKISPYAQAMLDYRKEMMARRK